MKKTHSTYKQREADDYEIYCPAVAVFNQTSHPTVLMPRFIALCISAAFPSKVTILFTLDVKQMVCSCDFNNTLKRLGVLRCRINQKVL